MMGEKISVIVPVYNVEAYLERCVESILQQTYAHFELILINDGSTDSSGQICDHLASQYLQMARRDCLQRMRLGTCFACSQDLSIIP